MTGQLAGTKKHRITLSEDEIRALAGRLVPIKPMDYSLKEFAILRNLYGRFTRYLLRSGEGEK